MALGGSCTSGCRTCRAGWTIRRRCSRTAGCGPARRTRWRVVPGSWLHRVAGATTIAINSLHNQGIDRLAPGWSSRARRRTAPSRRCGWRRRRVRGRRAVAPGIRLDDGRRVPRHPGIVRRCGAGPTLIRGRSAPRPTDRRGHGGVARVGSAPYNRGDPHGRDRHPSRRTRSPFPSRAAACFPVRRIFCVGRNYAAHAREMGHDPDREPPFFFTKPADSLVTAARTCRIRR